jgi:cytochrome bd-type quinol oxidase subunit 2
MADLLSKKILLILVLPLLLVLFFSSGTQASAWNLFNKSCNGNSVQGGNGQSSTVCTASNKAKNSNSNNNIVLHTINVIANILALVAGLVAVLMIIVAGFTYVTSGGNAEETKKARSRILYAAVGLAIIALSWTITRFITDKVLQ